MDKGFLGFHATFMLDVVVCALVLVVPALIYSIYQVKIKQNYARHKFLQLGLAGVLAFAVAAFEVDIQLIHGGWQNVVTNNASPDPPTDEEMDTIRRMLNVHLCFAVTTPILWAATIVLALKRFPNPPAPSPHSRLHRILGWLSTIDITLTSITGLMFYYLAFIEL